MATQDWRLLCLQHIIEVLHGAQLLRMCLEQQCGPIGSILKQVLVVLVFHSVFHCLLQCRWMSLDPMGVTFVLLFYCVKVKGLEEASREKMKP